MRISSESPKNATFVPESASRSATGSSGTLLPVAAPLFELLSARIDVESVPAVDGLTLTTSGDRVVVLGGPKALFEAVGGVRTPSHGEVRVRGVPSRRAARHGRVAGAPVDPPLPPRWTALEYVTWSARLSGHRKKDAMALAEQALAQMKVIASAGEKLSGASLPTRRSVSIAAALATGAETILLEDPLLGLSDDGARHFARTTLRALEGRGWALFAGRLPLESPFAMDADEAAVVTGRRVLAQGAPAELASRERAYAVRVLGHSEDFARLATARGAHVSGIGTDLTVDLGPSLAVSDLLRVAVEAEATVLELEPVAHAFS
jgi:ABC-type multidrug transport system ATPase subunit